MALQHIMQLLMNDPSQYLCIIDKLNIIVPFYRLRMSVHIFCISCTCSSTPGKMYDIREELLTLHCYKGSVVVTGIRNARPSSEKHEDVGTGTRIKICYSVPVSL